jgi:hypothetical protein
MMTEWPSHGPREVSAEGEGRKRGGREKGVERERRRKRRK